MGATTSQPDARAARPHRRKLMASSPISCIAHHPWRCPLASIILLRHGQSVHHVTDLTGGWTDTGLTALGRRQASCVAARLAREIADAPYPLYTSDLLRASQTAAIIGRALNIAPAPEPGLRGYNNGIARGLTRQEADRIQAPRSRPFIDWRPCPESETWREFYTRTSSCMERLHATGQSLLIVTHGGVLINSIIWWLRLGVNRPSVCRSTQHRRASPCYGSISGASAPSSASTIPPTSNAKG